MAFYAWQLFVILVRGPHCKRYTWFGYEGGLEHRKSVVRQRQLDEEERDGEKNRQSVGTLAEKEKDSPNPSEQTAVASETHGVALARPSIEKKDEEINQSASSASAMEADKTPKTTIEEKLEV